MASTVSFRPRGGPRWVLWFWSVYTAGSTVMVVVGIASGRHWGPFALLTATGLWWIVVWFRKTRTIVADSVGLRRGGTHAGINWEQVDYVKRPSRWDEEVRLIMTDGAIRPTGFPPEYAERLAQLGDKPLR